MPVLRFAAASAIALATLAISASTFAAPSPKERAEAGKLAAEGKKAMKDKRWSDAIGALKKADQLDPSPALEVDLAQALAGGGKLLEAVKVLTPIAESSDNAPAAKKAREAAKKALGELKGRIPTVKVVVNGPPAEAAAILVDGVEARRGDVEVNPGSHIIGATADGFEPAEKEMNFAEGVRAEVELTLKAKPAAAPVAEKKTGSRVPGAILAAVGGAGLVVGGVFGGLAFKATSDAKAKCNGNLCPPEAADDISRSKLFGNVSTAALIAGGAVAAAGVVLLIVPPGGGSSDEPKEKDKEKSARVTPWMGPGGAGVVVSGAF